MNLTLLTALTIISFAFAKEIDLKRFLENNTAYNYLEKVGRRLAERIRTAEPRNAVTFIAEGTPSELGLYPYQVGLLFTFHLGESVCGGSLINSKRVLTAAHCWFDGRNQATDILAILGSNLLYSGGTRIKTNQIVMHSDWTPSLVRNDIAVIYLPSAVSFSSTIAAIALPSGSQLNDDFVGDDAVASGFGYTTPDHIFTNETCLYHVEMKVINNTVCSSYFPIAQPSNICASTTNGGGPRRGDSGGPLVTDDGNDGLVLIGVTSFGGGFEAGDDSPSVFTRVTSYMNFINSNL